MRSLYAIWNGEKTNNMYYSTETNCFLSLHRTIVVQTSLLRYFTILISYSSFNQSAWQLKILICDWLNRCRRSKFRLTIKWRSDERKSWHKIGFQWNKLQINSTRHVTMPQTKLSVFRMEFWSELMKNSRRFPLSSATSSEVSTLICTNIKF